METGTSPNDSDYSAQLFACVVVFGEDGGKASFEKYDINEPTICAYYYSILGYPLRFRRYPDRIKAKSPLTAARVSNFIVETTTYGEFSVIQVVARLTPSFLAELLSGAELTDNLQATAAYNIGVNEVIADLLPAITGEQLEEASDYKAVRHVLYLEPRQALASLQEFRDEAKIGSIVVNLRDRFGLPLRIIDPVRAADTIMFGGIGYGGGTRSTVAVGLLSLGSIAPDDINIPRIPLEYLNHAAICVMKKKISAQILALPFSAERYWDLHRSWSDFAAYRTQFLAERARAGNLLLQGEELSARIDETLPAANLYGNTYSTFRLKEYEAGALGGLLRESVEEMLKSERKGVDNELQKVMDTTRVRLTTLDGLLRDSATMHSASLSLQLSRSMKRITWLVTIMTILTFFVSVFPDRTKERLLDFIEAGWKSYAPRASDVPKVD